MSAGVRDREAALERATGGTPEVVVSTAAWEAVIYVDTAVLLGSVGVLATALMGAWGRRFRRPQNVPRPGSQRRGRDRRAELLLMPAAE